MRLTIKAPLRPFLAHQKLAYAYTADKSRVALFMEMRLGKSMVIIRWLRRTLLRRTPDARILLICPTSAFEGWMNELRAEFVPDTRVHWLQGSTPQRMAAAQSGPGWYLTNFEILPRLGVGFAALDWDAIVLDESTRIRNPKARTTKLLTRSYVDIPYRAILTGLPNPESSMDYFEQMKFLHGNFLGFHNFYHFRYTLYKQIAYAWEPKGGTRDRIKKYVHENAFVLTAKQAGIGNRIVYEPRYVDATPKIKAYMKDVKKNFRFDDLTTKWATVREVWLARLAGGFSPDQSNPVMLSDAKIKELWSLMTSELKGQQLVVWFRFNEEVRAVAQYLAKRGVDTGVMMGDTSQTTRLELQKWFRSGRIKILLMQQSVGKGGMGLDLSPASTAIYYSNVYEYEIRAQSEKRIEHPTKRAGLLIIDLLMRGTIDEDAYAVIREKRVEAKSFSRELWSRVLSRHFAGDEADPTTIQRRVSRVFPGTD